MSEIVDEILAAAVEDFFQFLQCQLHLEACFAQRRSRRKSELGVDGRIYSVAN